MDHKQYRAFKRDIDRAYDREVRAARADFDQKLAALDTLWNAVGASTGKGVSHRAGGETIALPPRPGGPALLHYCRDAIAGLDSSFRLSDVRSRLSDAGRAILRRKSGGLLSSTISQMVAQNELKCVKRGTRGKSGIYAKGPRWAEFNPTQI